jgi:hypothetical protein
MSGDGELNVMIPGVKINTIFVLCRIHNFMETTDCLQEEIMVFVNKISIIVHECSHHWGGSANKNHGEIYLLTWKVPDLDEIEEQATKTFEKSEIATKSLIAVLKIIIELKRSVDLIFYAKHPKIKQK